MLADIAWIRERAPGVPIVIKGIGCVEDVELAHQYGADGVVLVRLCSSPFLLPLELLILFLRARQSAISMLGLSHRAPC